MTKKPSHLIQVLAIAAVLLFVTAPLALAKTVTLFGPQTFVRAEGKPQLFRSSFPLPPSVTECRLIATTDDGSPLSANNVSIGVNGVEMIDAKELRKADGNAQEGVVLKSENSLEVVLKGKPGDSVSISVIGTAPDEPAKPPRPPVVIRR